MKNLHYPEQLNCSWYGVLHRDAVYRPFSTSAVVVGPRLLVSAPILLPLPIYNPKSLERKM